MEWPRKDNKDWPKKNYKEWLRKDNTKWPRNDLNDIITDNYVHSLILVASASAVSHRENSPGIVTKTIRYHETVLSYKNTCLEVRNGR